MGKIIAKATTRIPIGGAYLKSKAHRAKRKALKGFDYTHQLFTLCAMHSALCVIHFYH
jgi:class 3 adenylate cyclase